MTQDGGTDNQGAEKQGTRLKQAEAKEKALQNTSARSGNTSAEMEQGPEEDSNLGQIIDPQLHPQLPTKVEIAATFASLEKSLKTEITSIHGELGHLLMRVEEMESKQEKYVQTINDLNKEMADLRKEPINVLYKLEDQENRNRRKNLRVRGIPEANKGEDLKEKMKKIFNPLFR